MNGNTGFAADFRLCSFIGGVKMNAISKEARAVIACKAEDADANTAGAILGAARKKIKKS